MIPAVVLLVALAEPSPFTIVGKGEAVVVANLSTDEVAAWKTAPPKDPAAVFTLSLDKPDVPAMLGELKVEGGKLLFVPRFPLAAGVKYRAVFRPGAVPGSTAARDRTVADSLLIPKPPRGPATVLEQIYPSADVLPENQLKFYLHFSAPMSRGEVYRHIHLLDADGKEVVTPFLEVDQELWDRDLRRLTVFIDPGRIKQGLKPREDLGPVLEAGKTYTLVVDAAWEDGRGEPLKAGVRKRFKAVAADETQPDMKAWQIAAPKAGTTEPVTVTLPESLEHALMLRLIWIEDAAGKRVAGTATAGKHERSWQWTPSESWAAGAYKLVADNRLEDLAGNSLGRPFEVDVFRPVQREIKAETVSRAFNIEK